MDGVSIVLTVEVLRADRVVSRQRIEIDAGDIRTATETQAAILHAAHRHLDHDGTPPQPEAPPPRPGHRADVPTQGAGPGLFHNPPPPPSPRPRPTPFPTDNARNAADATLELIRLAIAAGEIHDTLADLPAAEICASVPVRQAIAELQLMNYADPTGAVIRYGPARCRQVVGAIRKYRAAGQDYRNPAGAIHRMLTGGHPWGDHRKQATA